MFCNKCGKQNPDGAAFCNTCGNPMPVKHPATQQPVAQQPVVQPPVMQQPVVQKPAAPVQEKPVKEKKPLDKKLLLALIAGIVCGALVMFLVLNVFAPTAGGRGGKIEGSGYASPEAAIEAYVEALKKGDVSAMIATFAVETYVDNYEITTYIDTYKSIVYGTKMCVEPTDSYTKGVLTGLRQTDLYRDLHYLYLELTGYNDVYSSEPVFISSKSENAEFKSGQEYVDFVQDETFMQKLAGMRIGAVRDAEYMLNKHSMSDSLESYLVHRLDYANTLGCEDYEELAIEVTVDGQPYYCFMAVAKYNGRWYNVRVSTQLASMVGIDSISAGFLKR